MKVPTASRVLYTTDLFLDILYKLQQRTYIRLKVPASVRCCVTVFATPRSGHTQLHIMYMHNLAHLAKVKRNKALTMYNLYVPLYLIM